MVPQPSVSVVVVNYNGLQHLEPCFRSLQRQSYPADLIELILVDNCSSDGSIEFMAAQFPDVKVLCHPDNRGFSPAVNYGARHASGQYLALINNDAYADPEWLRTLVTAMDQHQNRGVCCVGAKMLDWYGRQIDFVGGGVNVYGMGNQFLQGLPVDAVELATHEMLFACGGAMLVDRAIFLRLGGFDEDFFAYFEDVDFGWRLWLYGYRVLFVPDAVVYHRLHGTSSSLPNHRVNTLYERNALMTVLKNYEEQHLHRVLNLALLLTIARSLGEAGAAIDRRAFLPGSVPVESEPTATIALPKMAVSKLVAVQDVLNLFPRIWQKRQAIQCERVRPDREIVPLFRAALWASYRAQPYLRFQQILSETLGLDQLLDGTRVHRVLILSSDPLYERLAGPGIRAVEMARHLASTCQVTLAAPERAEVTIPDVTAVALAPGDHAALEHLIDEMEVVIIQGYALQKYSFLKTAQRILVIDLYDPFHLENLHNHSQLPPDEAQQRADGDRQIVNELLEAGDYFICASERQRDLWLGALASVGRLSPAGYLDDPTFTSLIGVVPFGIDPTAPVRSRPAVKGVVPGIGPDDILVLWGGGIWEWLDPLLVIRAMARVAAQRSDIKLFFLGHQHPNTREIPLMPKHHEAIALATRLGLLGKTVFFNDTWVPYAERASYLLEADIGVSAHLAHVETRFAFRTRLLDYIWVGLPMVVTGGDALADTVTAHGLGLVIDSGDEERFAEAIVALSGEADAKQRRAAAFQTVQRAYAWPEALRPLLEFCRRPRFAPRPARTPAAAQAASTSPDMARAQQRIAELETMIGRKDEHILYLENLLRRIEAGRMMQVLRRLRRVRSSILRRPRQPIGDRAQ